MSAVLQVYVAWYRTPGSAAPLQESCSLAGTFGHVIDNAVSSWGLMRWASCNSLTTESAWLIALHSWSQLAQPTRRFGDSFCDNVIPTATFCYGLSMSFLCSSVCFVALLFPHFRSLICGPPVPSCSLIFERGMGGNGGSWSGRRVGAGVRAYMGWRSTNGGSVCTMRRFPSLAGRFAG